MSQVSHCRHRPGRAHSAPYVEQRFLEMEAGFQDILGWASRTGARFVQRAVAAFAARRQTDTVENTLGHLETCVDPYAVLAAPLPSLLEFRDSAFYRVAHEHFRTYLAETTRRSWSRRCAPPWPSGSTPPSTSTATPADWAR